MTYLTLKTRLKALLFGESIFKEDATLKELVDMALLDIATRVIPFCLVSSDHRKYTPLRYINDEQFVRYPAKITDDNSIVEIDASLETALLNHLASFIVNEDKRGYYHKAYCIELDRYTFAQYKSVNAKWR